MTASLRSPALPGRPLEGRSSPFPAYCRSRRLGLQTARNSRMHEREVRSSNPLCSTRKSARAGALRATTDLARLSRDQGRRAEARGQVGDDRHKRQLSSSCPFARKSHDFHTAELRNAKRDGHRRRSIGEYAPVLSIAHVTSGRTFSRKIPKTWCHDDIRLFLLRSVAETRAPPGHRA